MDQLLKTCLVFSVSLPDASNCNLKQPFGGWRKERKISFVSSENENSTNYRNAKDSSVLPILFLVCLKNVCLFICLFKANINRPSFM